MPNAAGGVAEDKDAVKVAAAADVIDAMHRWACGRLWTTRR